MKFGLELELLIPYHNYAFKLIVNKLEALGVKIKWEGFSHSTAAHWKLVTDASVGKEGFVGYELVSPILEDTKETFEEIAKICNGLIEIGCIVDKCCGLHVHINASTITLTEAKIIYKRYQMHEAKIDSWMHASRRANEAQHCRTIVSQNINESAKTIDSLTSNRYYKLNLKSFVAYGTVEFRHHAGTLDSQKIIYWIMFIRGFMKSCRETYVQQKKSFEEKEKLLKVTKKASLAKVDRTFTDKLSHEILDELVPTFESKVKFKHMLKLIEYWQTQREKIVNNDATANMSVSLTSRQLRKLNFRSINARKALGMAHTTNAISTFQNVLDNLSWIASNSREISNHPQLGMDYPYYVSYDYVMEKTVLIVLPHIYAALKQICESRHSVLTQKKLGLWGPALLGNFDKAPITIERNDDLFRSIEPYVRNFYVERMEDLRNAA